MYVFFIYFFNHSSYRKDQFTVLSLKFGTEDFTNPGLLKIRRTLTGCRCRFAFTMFLIQSFRLPYLVFPVAPPPLYFLAYHCYGIFPASQSFTISSSSVPSFLCLSHLTVYSSFIRTVSVKDFSSNNYRLI